MSKRLFVGFPVEVGASLENAVKRVKIGADKREMELDWVPLANYHVTLNFLGNTPEEKISEISETLKRVASNLPPFTTSLRGLGSFPDDHHMRVLWAGVRKSRALSFLQSELTEALAHIGYAPEERDYVPHLTLARTRKSRSGKDLLSPYVRTSFEDIVVSRIALFESVIHGSKPVYKILESFELENQVDADETEIESSFTLDVTPGTRR
jgi:RNA 2',3'-cyclic 3'-phosphodiesterase